MKQSFLLLAATCAFSAVAQTRIAPTRSAAKTYTYVSVPGDPMGTRIYTLDNGLQVWLSRNTDAPRVQTNIAVRAGSKNDPADATGLAHYLEHMLFKGTSNIGTSDWAKESALLDRISKQYELRRTTTDEAKRDAIYRTIDSLSALAAGYAVPNEYDKMIKSIGARGTNAYTSTEQTVYINDVPSDELERWAMIESERMQECVLRLFHTELETVYEEFNRGQDNDGRTAAEMMDKLLYKKHPYGTQTTIGTGEHLKNPSMVKIHQFFDSWYVPNNMAIILAGDLDYDKTIALVDKYFGKWKRKEVPGFSFAPEDPINAPIQAEVFGPDREWVSLAWRFNGTKSDDPIMLELIAGILSNGKAGLFDLNLLQEQKVLGAQAFSGEQADYSEFGMRIQPREGQTLEEARDLALGQLEALKRGEFDDWLIEAVVNDNKQQQIRFWNEHNSLRASAMTDAFILRKDWQRMVDLYDRMGRITKQQVMDFAKARFNNNYVCVFKRTGEASGRHKVTKPKITPIDIKRDTKSAWRLEWEKVLPATMIPEFVDFNTAISRKSLTSGVELACVKNPSNDLFSLNYIVDMGSLNDRELRVAIDYLDYLGTSKYSPADLKKELFKLGLDISVSAGDDRSVVTLSGLDKHLEEGIQLLEHVLSDAQPNKEALPGLIADIRQKRQDQLKSKGGLLYSGLLNMARYGGKNPLNDILTNEQLAELGPQQLIDRIHGLTGWKHRIFYYGKKGIDEMAPLLTKYHQVPAVLKDCPPERVYPELPTTANTVLFTEYDMVQTEMVLNSKAGPFDAAKLPFASLFNEYFGSGLSSIVFQEIREAKALAYGANASYTSPAKKADAHYVRAFIGTQADKLPDALDAMLKLMNEMPMAEAQFEGAKTAALKVIASTRITKENIYWQWEAARRRGLDHDVRRDIYGAIPKITLLDMKGFFDKEIKGRPYTYCVIGKESGMDMKALERLGPVRKLTKKELFGYDEER